MPYEGKYMKICQNCFREFEDEANATVSSVGVLGDIFIETVSDNYPDTQDNHNLCPICREKLGIVNLLGYGL